MKRFVLVALLLLSSVASVGGNLNLYFGNPHSHTSYSDGSGIPEEAYSYAKEVPDLDFLAITDHAYYFAQDLPDGRNKLAATIEAAIEATSEDFLSFVGFEWTATGTGHINVYGTSDWTDRVKSDLWQLYDWIIEHDAVGQFNHPVRDFGDNFKEFQYSPEADLYMNLIEVGNGSWWENDTIVEEMFSAYREALRKGWHLGTTLGQDNHKPNWGGANDSRTAVFATDLSEISILEAFKKRRTYATEDRNIEIHFSTEEAFMGDIVRDADRVELRILIRDTADDPLEIVQIYSNDGVIANFLVDSHEFYIEMTTNIEVGFQYFFVYARGHDGEEAVSSPIWVERSCPIHLYNSAAFPESVKPGERVTLSFQISNLSSEEASSLLQIENLEGIIHEEIVTLEGFESKIVHLERTAEEHDARILFLLDSVPYSSTWLEIRSSASLNVLVDRSHINYASDEREKLKMLLEEMGNRVSTADRIFKVGELDTIDVLLLPLPGVGGSFDRLKILMPQQSNIIKEFVMNGGRLIITGTGDEISNEIISSYNRLLEEMGIYATYEKAITSDAVELDGIVFDGLSVLRGESGRHVYGKGEILLFPGDPFTDNVIENNKELLDQSFR